MDKKSKNTLIVSIIALALVLVGVTYAYFSARITGLESASTLSLTAGRMGIVYSEGDENISVNNIYPREEAWLTKTFTLTGWNTINQPMKYDIGLNVITNTFPDDYLTYDLRVLESTNGTPVSEKTGKSINGTENITFGKGSFTNADGDVHRYELKIYFKDNGLDQNDGQGAIFNAKIVIGEFKLIVNECIADYKEIISYTINQEVCEDYFENIVGYTSSEAHTYCSGDVLVLEDFSSSLEIDLQNPWAVSVLTEEGVLEDIVYGESTPATLYQDYMYVNGQYYYIFDGESGWSMRLVNPDSTNPITTKMCTSISGYPIISMNFLFSNSQAVSVDLSSFDTSKVTNMEGMFSGSVFTELDLSSFDTSNVIYMNGMFSESQVQSLDLSSFDTSNVVDMGVMFYNSKARSINLSSFDTSNVTNMTAMFHGSSATNIDISNFDTSRVVYMSNMFKDSAATSINVSSLSNDLVTRMDGMFDGSAATSINLDSFGTPSVRMMDYMFANTAVTSLDLSSFDTSNVTNMSYMFDGSSVQSLNLSSFGIRGGVEMYGMFRNTALTVLDISSFINDNGPSKLNEMFAGSSHLTTIYVDPSISSWTLIRNGMVASTRDMFLGCTALVGGMGTTYDSTKVNHQYARVDGGQSNPGYFTAK